MPIKAKKLAPETPFPAGKQPINTELWPIDRPIDYPKNARKWSSKAVSKVAQSLREFGFRQPIVVDAKDVICIGHLRRAAAREAGFTQVPVHVAADLSPEQIRQLRIMDNRSHDEAEWDLDVLAAEMKELAALDLDLSLTGFDKAEFVSFMAGTGLTDPDEVPPEPARPVTVAGDLWLLGDHRLLCGDATAPKDVVRLMAGQLAALVYTDPPYGVGYDGGTTAREKIVGDEDAALYDPCCKMAAAHSQPTAALYLWHAGVKGIAAAAAAAAAGYQIRCEIVWNKNLAQFGSLSAQYKQKHEPCYYCYRKPPKWYGPTNEITVWDCNRSSANEFHPTQKPVELAERAIRNSSSSGEVVLDLFGGSGSTMLACQTTDRHARLCEIQASYCDVIVQRWQNFTGREATLEADGRTFAAVGAERLA